MWNENLLYLIFLSQIIIISAYLPKMMLNQLNNVFTNSPPQHYQKLYPMPIEQIKQYSSRFLWMNITVTFVGLAILFHLVFSGNKEMLDWDTQSVITLYWMIQFIPYCYAVVKSKNYFSLMKKQSNETKRKAEFKPRRFFDFISPVLITFAGMLYLCFIGLVIYFVQNPFDGFAGYWNILFISLMNIFLSICIFGNFYRKKSNPHQTQENSNFKTKLTLHLLVLASIGGTLFISTAFVLSAFDLRHIIDIVHSFYFQILVVFSLHSYRLDKINFNVYKNETMA